MGIFDGFADAVDLGSNLIGNMFADERQNDSQQWATGENTAAFMRNEYMFDRRYQKTVADMKKAGLNPMLAYHQGAGQPAGASSTGAGTTSASPGHSIAAAAQSASQIDVNRALEDRTKAEAEKARAERDEIIARTPTHAVNIEQTKQQIGESAMRIEKFIQEISTGAASAALMQAQTRQVQELIPQIHATIKHLTAQAEQATATTEETRQRIKQDLPRLKAIGDQLDIKAREIDQPRRYQEADVKASFTGLLGDYLRALNPLNDYLRNAK